ncbi:MAG: hypothetical protein H8D56_22910 [Planctomycetes bacterium]|nr:hypothetical protein [Planctomycetota bacterium]MBL7146580.1 hypothetical protein [Phycisphaerae bacterium]
MKIIVNIMLIAILFIGGCASGRAESHSRAGYNFSMLDSVAVVAVEGALQSRAAKNQIAEYFEMELLKKGYAPKEWSNIAAALEEKEVKAEDLGTEAGLAEAAEIINVPAILIVNIPHFGDEIFITAKMVDVADGSVLWIGSGTSKTGGILGLGSGWGAGRSQENDLFGGVPGGVMGGGVADYALSPQDAEKVQRLIRRMCNTLPSRLTTEW